MESVAMDMRLWRARYGLTQERAAERLGCSLASWSRWERGITQPTGYWRMDLERMLDCAPWEWINLFDRTQV